MKSIFITLSLLISTCAMSQVAIGKSSVSNSVSLEFYDNADNVKGLILPWVDGTNNTAPFITNSPTTETVANGTIVYDTSDKKIKVKYATGWNDLSVDTSGSTVDPITLVDGLSIQNTKSDLANARVMIGGNPSTDTTPGILVLADKNKAMILPKVASPHLNIINPAPGMMAYDTVKNQLAVFNGTNWSFWKP